VVSDLKYAYEDALDWHIETVDSLGSVGEYTSLALDASGYPHISYYDSTSEDLKYAYEDAVGWHIETVDSLGSVGEYTSLALDGSGHPHISYYDATSEDLKYACEDALGWHIQTVDSLGSVGQYTSLALDASGFPHISYYDATNGDLKYVYRDASGWSGVVVDAAGDVGLNTSLSLGVTGVHVSYYDATNQYLKYAHQDASGWQTETVDEGVGPTSLALDASGYPHISYDKGGEVWYAWKTAVGLWQCEWAVLMASTSFYGGSLALDTTGEPHIVCGRTGYPRFPDTIDYTCRDESGWLAPSSLDAVVMYGGNRMLAIDAMGFPCVAYYVSYDLKYASGRLDDITLSGQLVGDQLVLSWMPVLNADAFWIYGTDNQPYFDPGFAPDYLHRLVVLSPDITTWCSTDGVGDPDHNWTYSVLAVDATEQELCRSNRIGEHDYTLTIGQ
jgi:hypothetical protein